MFEMTPEKSQASTPECKKEKVTVSKQRQPARTSGVCVASRVWRQEVVRTYQRGPLCSSAQRGRRVGQLPTISIPASSSAVTATYSIRLYFPPTPWLVLLLSLLLLHSEAHAAPRVEPMPADMPPRRVYQARPLAAFLI